MLTSLPQARHLLPEALGSKNLLRIQHLVAPSTPPTWSSLLLWHRSHLAESFPRRTNPSPVMIPRTPLKHSPKLMLLPQSCRRLSSPGQLLRSLVNLMPRLVPRRSKTQNSIVSKSKLQSKDFVTLKPKLRLLKKPEKKKKL